MLLLIFVYGGSFNIFQVSEVLGGNSGNFQYKKLSRIGTDLWARRIFCNFLAFVLSISEHVC